MSNVTVITHPLVQHKLTLMRKKDASTNSFRRLLGELSTLMAYVCGVCGVFGSHNGTVKISGNHVQNLKRQAN